MTGWEWYAVGMAAWLIVVAGLLVLHHLGRVQRDRTPRWYDDGKPDYFCS
jgi:bacteriorhodopsin